MTYRNYFDAEEFFYGKTVRLIITKTGSYVVEKGKNTELLTVSIYVNSVQKITTSVNNNDWIKKGINIDSETFELHIFSMEKKIEFGKEIKLSASLNLTEWNTSLMSYDKVGGVYNIEDVELVDKSKGGSSIVTFPKGTGTADLKPKTVSTPMSYVGNCQGWAFYKTNTNDKYEWRKDKDIQAFKTLQTAIEAFAISANNEEGMDLEQIRKALGVSIDFRTDLTQYEHEKAVREKMEKLAGDDSEFQLYLVNIVKTALNEMTPASKRKITRLMKNSKKKARVCKPS